MFFRIVVRKAGNPDQVRHGRTNKCGAYRSLASARNGRSQLYSHWGWRRNTYDKMPTRHIVIQRLYAIDNELVWRDVDAFID